MGQQITLNSTKPGVKTSEFWIMLVNQIVGVLVMLGYLTPQQAGELNEAVVSVVGGMIIIISFAIYLWGRVQVKSKGIQTISDKADVLTANQGLEFATEDPSGKLVPISSK